MSFARETVQAWLAGLMLGALPLLGRPGAHQRPRPRPVQREGGRGPVAHRLGQQSGLRPLPPLGRPPLADLDASPINWVALLRGVQYRNANGSSYWMEWKMVMQNDGNPMAID